MVSQVEAHSLASRPAARQKHHGGRTLGGKKTGKEPEMKGQESRYSPQDYVLVSCSPPPKTPFLSSITSHSCHHIIGSSLHAFPDEATALSVLDAQVYSLKFIC